jgi:D-arginine dehydrogenase
LQTTNDIIIIGGGIAGVSLGARLAVHNKVTILEMEQQPGYHATGRSAAFFAPAYGNKVVRTITAASEAFFRNPPDDFTDVALLHPRDALYVARQDQREIMSRLLSKSTQLSALDGKALAEKVPILDTDTLVAGALDESGGDLDVDAILQGYLRRFRMLGGEIITNSKVEQLRRINGKWVVRTADAEYQCAIIVNAAGAWADSVAVSAGLRGLGIQPLRRTVVLVDAPPACDISSWPLTIDIEEQFYFKPDAGQLLISPADETPARPCDAQPEEMDIAIAIERVRQVTDLDVQKINHSWAGLRSFAPDKTFVTGFDPQSEGFFWFAGQGGYGVQSSPALADIGSYLISGHHELMSREAMSELLPLIAPDRLISQQVPG